jgi:protein-disulfide isomerase
VRSTRTLILVGVAAAVLVAAIVVSVIVVGARGGDDADPGPVAGGDIVVELLDGVPQQGSVLGSDDAPVTLVEYADIQCSHCATFARDGFPHLVWDYVREGDLRIELRGMAFIGEDSERALRAVLAAGQQNRAWHVLDLLFYAQDQPNTGWVTDGLLRSIGAAVPDLDTDQMFDDMDSSAVDERIAADAQAAQEAEVPGTPYFEIGRTGEELRPLTVESLSADAFRPAIDELLQR